MTLPYYASAEQIMRDRSELARKGIARGRSVIALTYADGVLLVAENPSKALHKISELYDRVGFAAVGKYNEFENLRVAGVRYADLRGYSYDRADVTARGLANAYAQTLGAVFTTESKPLEVEIAVTEVGVSQDGDQIYRLAYDGSVTDEPGHVVMGGDAERLGRLVADAWRPGLSLPEAVRLAVTVLGTAEDGTVRAIDPAALEAAVLDRTRTRRAFRRLHAEALAELLATDDEDDDQGDDGSAGTETDAGADAGDDSGPAS